MTNLSVHEEEWFRHNYSHSIMAAVQEESAREAVFEDWALYEAVVENRLPLDAMPDVSAFESLRNWRIRVQTGLSLLGYEGMADPKAQADFDLWTELASA